MVDPALGVPAGCPEPDLAEAGKAIDLARSVVDSAARRLATSDIDEEQVVAYDMAHAAAAVRTAEAALGYGESGATEACIACAFTADMMAELASRTVGREEQWGAAPDWMIPASGFLTAWRAPVDAGRARGTRGPTDARSGLRPRTRDLQALRRREGQAQCRARAPHQLRRSRGDHRGARRAGRFRSVGAGGVRRIRDRIRERLPRDGHRHRRTVVGLARDRRLSDHPPRDPLKGPRARGYRGSEARLAPDDSPQAR